MPATKVIKKIVINKPVSEVFPLISDFNHWTTWSPWIIMDPKAETKVSEDSKYYEWSGPRTGDGNMQITSEVENQSVDSDLTFLKPWKSKSTVRFETKEVDGGTEVTWIMNGKLPFFMFWMKSMMETFVGMDFDRGLRLLKDLAEDGETHSKLKFTGNKQLDGFKYIGIKTACSFDEMGKKMGQDIPKLFELVENGTVELAGNAFTQYHKWNMGKKQAEYTSGIPVKEIPANLPSGITAGEIPSTPVYSVEHLGPYHHLGNAWTTLYTMQRQKEINVNKKIHPIEFYTNNPSDTPENELVTSLQFPLK